MTFAISRATLEDIPGIIDVWFSAFSSPLILEVFPDNETCREWVAASIAKGMREKQQNTVYMIMKEVLDTDISKGRVVSLSKWIIHPGGPLPDWDKRWVSTLPVDMSEERVGDGFFHPMARQHAVAMSDRPHYFLEVLATHQDYRKLALASTLLEWGCAAADKDGWESYLDAAATAKLLYEKHGYVQQPFQDEKARSLPMVRPVTKN